MRNSVGSTLQKEGLKKHTPDLLFGLGIALSNWMCEYILNG